MRPRNWILALLSLVFSTFLSAILVKSTQAIFNDTPAWDAVYVINLDRRPDRYSKVHALLNKYGIRHTRFSAVDGYKLTFKDLERADPWRNSGILVFYPGIPEAAFKCHNISFRRSGPLTPGELGCTYSHRAIWKDIVKKGYKLTIIFEDDIVGIGDLGEGLSKIFKNWPPKADLVFIDFLYFSSSKRRFIEARNGLSPKFNGMFVDVIPRANIWGTHAYAVTLKGAQELLKITDISSVPLDVALDSAISGHKIKAYMNVKRIIKNQWEDSDIAKMGRKV